MYFDEEEHEVYLYPNNSFFNKKSAKSVLNIKIDICQFNIDFICSGKIYSPGCGNISLNYSIRKKSQYHHDMHHHLLKMLNLALNNEDEEHIFFKKFSISTKSKKIEKNFDIVLEGEKITVNMIKSAIDDLIQKFGSLRERHGVQQSSMCMIL